MTRRRRLALLALLLLGVALWVGYALSRLTQPEEQKIGGPEVDR